MIDFKKTVILRYEVPLPNTDRVSFFNSVIGGPSDTELLTDFLDSFNSDLKLLENLEIFLMVFDTPLRDIPIVNDDFDFESLDPFLLIQLY